jgi:hypothetical protein
MSKVLFSKLSKAGILHFERGRACGDAGAAAAPSKAQPAGDFRVLTYTQALDTRLASAG